MRAFVSLCVASQIIFCLQLALANLNDKQNKNEEILNKATKDWYYDTWCGRGNLHYLDDADCLKTFPSQPPSRDWQCKIASNQSTSELEELNYRIDSPLKNLTIDVTTLQSFNISNQVNGCLILTKRVNIDGEIKLFNKYLCIGESSKSEAFETWSSSKIFAMANAAGHLRSNESNCKTDEFGLDASTYGKHGLTPLGDLSTIVCSYDTSAGYTSNSLSSYFHDLGWRDRIHSLVTSDWLGLLNHTLGGNYGETTPSDLKYDLTSGISSFTCNADKDPWPKIYDNTLSTLASAEMARRIVLHEHIDPDLRFPGLTLADAMEIMLGTERSVLFPGATWGGMAVDTGIFVQSGLNITDIESRSHGAWRIYSKLGAGYSNSRHRGEIITTAYACLPSDNMEGVEFTLSMRGSVPNDSSLKIVEELVASATQTIVRAIMNGSIY